MTARGRILRIDVEHTEMLLNGRRIGVRIPPLGEMIEVQLSEVALEQFQRKVLARLAKEHNGFAKVLDVFFNGRPA